MAERKTGPVKPPTIDLVARSADDAAAVPSSTSPMPDPEAASPPPLRETAVPPPGSDRDDVAFAASAGTTGEHPPPLPMGRDWGAVATAAGLGAVGGVVLVYILGALLPLPMRAPYPDPTPDLAAQSARLSALEEAAGLASTADTSRDAAIEALSSRIDGLPTDAVAPAEVDALAQRVQALGGRVDALAAGVSSADAGALGESIARLEAELGTLREEVAARAAEPPPEPTPPPAPTADAAVAALAAAFLTGAPYTAALAALPSTVTVPENVVAAADDGLRPPGEIAVALSAAVPAMIAARPVPPEQSWQDGAVDWLGDLLALRPSGEVPGDTPEAVLARLEAAAARQDMAGAADLMDKLPEPMRAAAGTLPADLALHRDAQALLRALRAGAAGGRT